MKMVIVRLGIGVSLSVLLGILANWSAPQRTPAHDTTALDQTKPVMCADAHTANVPFIANLGQYDTDVRYSAQTFAGHVFVLENGEIVYAFPTISNTESRGTTRLGLALQETIIGGEITSISGEGRAVARTNYFRGNDPTRWINNVPTFTSVSFGEVYQGIELSLRTAKENVEKIFHLDPGAEPGAIRLRLEGADELAVNARGELEVKTELGDVSFTRPMAYQETEAGRKFIDIAYAVEGPEYGFTVGPYDPDYGLTIDPLLASTYLGGEGTDGGGAAADVYIDDDGYIYVAGASRSADFPYTIGVYQEDHGGAFDVTISKFDSSLSTILMSTYLGGVGDECTSWPGVEMVPDGDGNICICGLTSSGDFPTTATAYDTSHNGAEDAFITKLTPDLSSLVASTLIGGNLYEEAAGLTIGPDGTVYITGRTKSTDFPTTPGAYDESHNGSGTVDWGGDAFIAGFDPDLTTLIGSTFLGGSNWDNGNDVVVDQDNDVWVVGTTACNDFPFTEGVLDSTYSPGGFGGDVFVSSLSGDLTQLLVSTYIGSFSDDWAYAVALDESGDVYVAGHTASPNYPTTIGAYSRLYFGACGSNCGNDVFVTRISPDLTTLVASTFIGGSGWEWGVSLMVLDTAVIVAGSGDSDDYPTTDGAHDRVFGGPTGIRNGDGIISRLDRDLTTLTASTYLGGSGKDAICAITLDRHGNLYAAGTTESADFPTTPMAYDRSFNGGIGGFLGGDIFVSAIDLDWAIKDYDEDGYLNGEDNCPNVFNVPNDDADLDGIGDACDNCEGHYNPEQEDLDRDGIGDSCEVNRVWHVQPDGGGDVLTVQIAIDSSFHGDTIMLADGVYTVDGESICNIAGRRVVICSENGPLTTTIDCQGSVETPRRAFTFDNGETNTTVIDGFTIENGYGPIHALYSSGGAILCNNTSPVIKNCVFADNAAMFGGAVYAERGSPQFINCTFVNNTGDYGAAIHAFNQADVILENSVISYSWTGVPAHSLEYGDVILYCCNVFGNQRGNWVDCLIGEQWINDNFSADPLFCFPSISDVGLLEDSPCLAENNDCGVLIGALGMGCSCNCGLLWGDVNGDEALNPVDIVYMVNFVYKSQDARVQPPNCPNDAGDVDCDGNVNPVDVVYFVNNVYKSQDAFCAPCGE